MLNDSALSPADLRQRISPFIPEFELDEKMRLIERITELKEANDAIILGHNYMEPALYHGVADVTGDSLELCRKAASTDKSTIVFAGVEFMAETAKIINPDRRVLIPSNRAGCSLASSINAADVVSLRQRYPGVPVVSYINTYAEVKAVTDICCTSGNAAEVVASLDSDTVIFIPDEYLARNVAAQTGKHIIFPSSADDASSSTELDKVFISWNGKCEVHDQFTVDDVSNIRRQFPEVVVLAHPECPPQVVEAADFSGSTSKMISYVKDIEASHYLLLTECSMADNIIAENPSKNVLRLCSVRCPHMAQITLQDTVKCLENMQYEITLSPEIMTAARRSIDRMLAI